MKMSWMDSGIIPHTFLEFTHKGNKNCEKGL